MVLNFFNKTVQSEDILKDNFRNAESEFDPNEDENLKLCLDDVATYMKKLHKILTKVRQLKLTFTIEDQRLINLVDQVTDDQIVEMKVLKDMYEETKITITEIIDEFEEVDLLPFEDADDELNNRLKDITVMYLGFFKSEKDLVLEHFFLNCYLFRNEKFNEILNHTATFLNLVLKKINIYKTAIFIHFYDEQILRVLKANTDELNDKLRSILEHENPVAEFERLLQLTLKTSVLINYIKSMIVSKKHNDEVFANSFLRRKLPEVLIELKNFEDQYKKVQKELGHLDHFINLLPEYLHATREMKTFLGNVKPNTQYNKEGLFNLNNALQSYNSQKVLFENLILHPKEYNSQCLKLIDQILQDNNSIYYDLKQVYFKLMVS